MTKRLTFVGLAAVAVVWGPYVYSEFARRPLDPTASEPRAIDQAEPVQVTPVAFAPAPAVEPVQPELEPTTTVIEPASDPAVAAPAPPEPAAQPTEAQEPAPVAQPSHAPVPAALPEAPGVQVAQVEPPPAAAVEDNAHKSEPAAAEQPAEGAAKAEAPAEAADPAAAAAQAEALAPAFRSTFDRESRDAQWAEHEEPRLTQLLASSGVPAGAISEVRCQSTVCRVAFNASDLENISPVQLAQLVQRVREEFGPSLALDPAKREGNPAAAFYVLRKGYELGRGRDSL